MAKIQDPRLHDDSRIDRLALLVVARDLARQVEELCDLAGAATARSHMTHILHLLDRDSDTLLAMHSTLAGVAEGAR